MSPTKTDSEAFIPLPNCSVRLPLLGVGTWAWGDERVWGMNTYDRSYGLDSIREALHSSFAAGVTFLDTAEGYGRGESERIIGKLLREDPSLEERAIIATKFFPAPWKLRVESALLRALRASLDRLQRSSVHLYQLHGPVSLRGPEALAEGLAAAVHAKLVHAVGVSNYSEQEVRAIHAALKKRGVSLATNQVEYSLLRTRPESTGLLSACKELGVTVLAYSPLGMGRLTGKYSAKNPPPGRRNFSAYPMEKLEPLLEVLARIGKAHGDKTPSQVALRWIIEKGAVPIPGAKNRSQAEQNAGALGWSLTDEDRKNLDAYALPGLRGLAARVWQHG